MVFTFWQSSSVFLGLNEAQTKCLLPGRDRPVWFSLKLLQVLREWPGWPLPSLLKFGFCLKTVFCAPDLLVAEAQDGDFVSLSPQFSVSIRLTLETDWDSLGQEWAALVTCQKNQCISFLLLIPTCRKHTLGWRGVPGHQEQTLKNWGGLTTSQGAGNFFKADFAPVESVSFGMKVLTLLLFRRRGTGTLLLFSVDPKRGKLTYVV